MELIIDLAVENMTQVIYVWGLSQRGESSAYGRLKTGPIFKPKEIKSWKNQRISMQQTFKALF